MIGALDIGGTKIAAGLVEEDGHLLSHTSTSTQTNLALEDALTSMVNMLTELSSKAASPLAGVGIGCTGPVFPKLGTIGKVEFMPKWEGANLVEMLSDRLGVSVAIENDADAAALGEWAWGAGRGTQTFLLITIGTGIGVGLVIHGKIYRGVDSAHPEIGHHVIDPSGPLCFCGAHGCWESLASGPAMERWLQAHYPQPRSLSAQQICQLAEQGDQKASEAVKHTAYFLGIGLANMITQYIPECIALGGGLMQSFGLFREQMLTTIDQNCGLVPHEKVQILPVALGLHSGLIGAARVWVEHFTASR